MSFNHFVWQLYCDSGYGRACLSRNALDYWPGDALSNPRLIEIEQGDELDLVDMIRSWAEEEGVTSPVSLNELYVQLVRDGIHLLPEGADESETPCFSLGGEGYEDDIYNCIGAISMGLHLAHPDHFLPYLYRRRFAEFIEICETFSIPLPTVPSKLKKAERALYYLEVNQALQEFRTRHGLTAAEFNAFLYDFAPAYLRRACDPDLPSPMRVWLLIGGSLDKSDFAFLDAAQPDTKTSWGGSTEARRGDIAIMWCASPRSYIHSIWRVERDGYVDPFFHYHGLVTIGRPIRVPMIKFREIQTHPVLGQMPAVRSRFQGASRVPWRLEDYEALLDLFADKGFDVSTLPCLQRNTLAHVGNINNERDVEVQLIEPFLIRLGYQETDWTRQLPIRMGRNERVYSDYAIAANKKRGEESAVMIIESKYRISTARALMDAYLQAKSYALRLQCKAFVLASVDGVWVYMSDLGYDYEKAVHKSWQALQHPDNLAQLCKLIGKSDLSKKR